jgi:hypothetical protein
MKDFWKSLVEKLFEWRTIVFFVLGIALVLLALNHGYKPIYITLDAFASQVIVFVIGMGFIGLGVINYIRADNHKSVPSAHQLKKKYGLTITSPQPGGNPLPSPIRLTGTFKEIPPSHTVCSLCYNPQTRLYWPKHKLSYNSKNLSWQTDVEIGNGDNQIRVVMIAHFGENSLRLLEYFKSGKTYSGIENFPADFQILDQVEIVIAKPDPGPGVVKQ